MALLIARLVILIASLECAHGNSLQREGNTRHLVLSFSRCSDECVVFEKRAPYSKFFTAEQIFF